jgi:hypothetical protein
MSSQDARGRALALRRSGAGSIAVETGARPCVEPGVIADNLLNIGQTMTKQLTQWGQRIQTTSTLELPPKALGGF